MCSLGGNGKELRGNRLTQVHPEQWPLKWSVCAYVCVRLRQTILLAIYLIYRIIALSMPRSQQFSMEETTDLSLEKKTSA